MPVSSKLLLRTGAQHGRYHGFKSAGKIRIQVIGPRVSIPASGF
jgi:hypothetical protein